MLSRPTLSELKAINETNLALGLELDTPLLPQSFAKIIASTWAAADYGIYGYIVNLGKQVIIDTANTEYLERWASIWGLSRKDAAYAVGEVTFNGVDGNSIPAGTLLVRADNEEFETDSLVTISGGNATVSATSVNAGASGNTEETTVLNISSPISGVDSEVTVDTGGLTGGAAQESDDLLRARLLLRIQNPPQGGSETDYILWCLENSGVTRAWAFENISGAGTVGVTFVLDDNETSIIPNAAKVQEVQDYIDERRPLTANVTVFAPVATNLDITVDILPNTTAVQNAILASLEDMILRDAEPGGEILLSRIKEAISTAEGEQDHNLILPIADVSYAATELAVLGTVTFGSL